MRILLIAYNYPPQASPQAIRWYYLSRELARRGVEVHVLAPDIPAQAGAALEPPAGVVVHRCDAGGLAGWLARMQRRRRRNAVAESRVEGMTVQGNGAITLNWKGRWLRRAQRWIGLMCFPDSRGQWRRPARAALVQLVETLQPDVLISSHEPAVTLELGLGVIARVPAWLADMGDPVLTPYTPPRWRRRARLLEAAVCRAAGAISVTTAETRELLRTRHAADTARIFVLSQGYDDNVPRRPATTASTSGQFLHLLYSGRFYPFRDPTPLLEAVAALDRVRLTVIAPEVSPELLAYAGRSNGRIVFTGEQPHARVLEWQRDCDVLVNIGNALHAQLPGKLIEYLGSGKPILHCQSAGDDPAVPLLERWRCGRACPNDTASLKALLTDWLAAPESLIDLAVGDAAAIAEHGWSRLGAELFAQCERLVAKGAATKLR